MRRKDFLKSAFFYSLGGVLVFRETGCKGSTTPSTTTTTSTGTTSTTTTTIPGSVALVDVYHGKDGSAIARTYGISFAFNNSFLTSVVLSGIKVYFLYLPIFSTASFASTELDLLQNFVNSGGNIIVVGRGDGSTPSKANPLTSLYGLTLGGDTAQFEYMNSFVFSNFFVVPPSMR